MEIQYEFGEETLTALDASIEHWDAHSIATAPPAFEATRSEGCALCSLYSSDDCNGCPIKQREKDLHEEETGDNWDGCDGSPWSTANTNALHWRLASSEVYAVLFRTSARDMAKYLRMIRHEIQKQMEG